MTLEALYVLVDDGMGPAAAKNAKAKMDGWLKRGDGVAVYEDSDLGSPNLGHRKYVSFGSEAAQLETDDPPTRLPDIGGSINWRYTLIGTVRLRTDE